MKAPVAPDLPEADCAEGAVHPRLTETLFGHEAAQDRFLDAFNSGRLHHAWLITGPPGIGKATLAWRLARFLLTMPVEADAGLFGDPAPATTLDPQPDTALLSRMAALSEPGLFLLRRGVDEKTKKLRSVITVDEVRALKGFFALSRPDGGRRVVIIDAADEMNTNAANALLKQLEEPPKDTVFLLISHMPARLLPTIRSRCRVLACTRLQDAEMTAALSQLLPEEPEDSRAALAALSDGSPGTALRMQTHDGVALGREINGLLATMPGVDRMRALGLATRLAARGAEAERDLCLDLLDHAMARLARLGILGGDDPLSHLSPTPQAGRRWAEAQQGESARVRRGLAVNLDPHALILDMVLRIDKLAGDCAAGR
jgi:DNA polymerase-3 subunit delta'